MNPVTRIHFWFQIISMKVNEIFEQREENGEWRPPRPLGSNVINTEDDISQAWFEYNHGSTVESIEPSTEIATHFKTYSFYFDRNRFWVYPCNAVFYQVGDGKIHPPSPETSGPEDVSSSTSSSSGDNEDDHSLEDWKPLSFIWNFDNARSATSCATHRGQSEHLEAQRGDQSWPLEVLPNNYHALGAQGSLENRRCGLVGKLPILIALIAFSVPPDLVAWALTRCLRQTYTAHGERPGRGWIPQRGLVVRVMREQDATLQKELEEDSPAFQRLRSFEYGRSVLGTLFD